MSGEQIMKRVTGQMRHRNDDTRGEGAHGTGEAGAKSGFIPGDDKMNEGSGVLIINILLLEAAE